MDLAVAPDAAPAIAAPFDVIIVGAGVAGLALVRHLLRDGPPTWTIAVVDAGDPRDHNLAFWTDRETPADLAPERVWRRIRAIAADGAAATRPLVDHTYQRIHRRALQAAAVAAAADSGRVTFLRGRSAAIVDGEDAARVELDGAWQRGRWIFDARPPEVDVDHRRHVALWQRFVGLEIEAASPCFDPEVATLFDFRVDQGGEVRFVYVLPSSPTAALVELVAIGARPELAGLPDALDRFLAGTLGIAAPRVVAREGGASLLTDQPFRRRVGRRVATIGLRGGRLKPSSGYALVRIERDSAAIARSLRERGHPFDLPRERRLFRLLDALLLQVLGRQPARGAAIFSGLVRRCPADALLRFLDERPDRRDFFAVVRALSPWIFARALLRWIALQIAAALGARWRMVEAAGAQPRSSKSADQA